MELIDLLYMMGGRLLFLSPLPQFRLPVWFSLKLANRYSYHWERRAIDGTLYRHDNAPHKRWQSVETFPQHFHEGSETRVVESHLSAHPKDALREFLQFVREKMGV